MSSSALELTSAFSGWITVLWRVQGGKVRWFRHVQVCCRWLLQRALVCSHCSECHVTLALLMRRAADKKHGRGVMLYGTSGKANNGEYSWCCTARWPCLRCVCAGAFGFYLLTCMCRKGVLGTSTTESGCITKGTASAPTPGPAARYR